MPNSKIALCFGLLLLSWPARAEAPRRKLDLREAVDRALTLDPQVLSSLISYDRGKLAVLRAQLDRFSLKVDGILNEQWAATQLGRSAAATQTSGDVNVSAQLQVPIFAGWRITSNIAAAKLNRDAAQVTARANARTVALDVLRAYWSIRRLDLQGEVSEKALQRYAEALTIVKSRVSGGLAPPVDINRMETRHLREQARLANLRGSAAEGRAQLAVLLQLGGSELELTEPAEIPAAPPARADEVDRLLAEAGHRRPDLAAARLQRQSLEQQVRIARSAYFPQLSAGSLLQWGNAPWVTVPVLGTDANPFANTAGAFIIGATLSINLFDTFKTRTTVRDVRYQVELQRQEERRLGRLVELDVRTAHARLLKLYSSREALLRSFALARDSLDIVERRYKNGDALILDFLDAQFELFNTESDVVDSTVGIAQTWGELQAATGRVPGPPQRTSTSGGEP